MILAGDIGGTNTRLAFYESREKRLHHIVMETFSSKAYESLEEFIKEFQAREVHKADYACFGVAGPVKDGKAEVTNLDWVTDERSLEKELNLKMARLVNDLEANAQGISELEARDFSTINKGKSNHEGGAALIAAGTGLGEAGLFRHNGKLRPFPSEGGHVGFAPENELEMELLIYLQKEYGHVSFERVLSGPGLYNIYRFLLHTGRGSESALLKERLAKEEQAGVISNAALEDNDPLSVAALDIFVSIYGSEAGNLALKLLATGGLYIGGGIAPKIIDKLKGPFFMKSFANKGRMAPLLRGIPVQVILNDKTALLGAARVAADMEAG